MDQDTKPHGEGNGNASEPQQSHRGRALTHEQLTNRFSYHPPSNPMVVALHAGVSESTLGMALEIRNTTAPSREQSLALTALEDVRMRWNQAIALDGAGFKANER